MRVTDITTKLLYQYFRSLTKDREHTHQAVTNIRFYTASMAYNGENLAQISRMMGHSQVSTTLHYLRDAKQNEDCSELFKKLGAQRGSNFNDN